MATRRTCDGISAMMLARCVSVPLRPLLPVSLFAFNPVFTCPNLPPWVCASPAPPGWLLLPCYGDDARRTRRGRRVRRRRGGGGDSRRLHQTRPHTPGQDESGDGSLVKRNTAGAKEIRAGLYLTFPTCGLHLGGCVCSIPSLTVRVSQRVSPRVIDLITTSTREELLKEISKDFT